MSRPYVRVGDRMRVNGIEARVVEITGPTRVRLTGGLLMKMTCWWLDGVETEIRWSGRDRSWVVTYADLGQEGQHEQRA